MDVLMLQNVREKLYVEVERFDALSMHGENIGIVLQNRVSTTFDFDRLFSSIPTRTDDVLNEIHLVQRKRRILSNDHKILKAYCKSISISCILHQEAHTLYSLHRVRKRHPRVRFARFANINKSQKR